MKQLLCKCYVSCAIFLVKTSLSFFFFCIDAPKFMPPPSSKAVGTEGEPLQVSMVANANPASITYTWTKDGMPIMSSSSSRIVSEGPQLNITNLTRTDAGVYTCEAVNSQGSDTINITVVVECKLILGLYKSRS